MRLNGIGSITRDVWTRPSLSLHLWGLFKHPLRITVRQILPRILSVVIAFNTGEERVLRLNRWSPKVLLGISRC